MILDQIRLRGSPASSASLRDNHSEILCATCNLKMTPTHQCRETDKTQPKSNADRDLLSTRASAEKSCDITVKYLKRFGFGEAYIEKRLLEFGKDMAGWDIKIRR